MARIINLTVVLLGFIVRTINGETADKISFLIDQDITCTCSDDKYTEYFCDKWKKLMAENGHNSITCVNDGTYNLQTKDPYYECSPKNFRRGANVKPLITNIYFQKNQNKDIVGLHVIVNSITMTTDDYISVFCFIVFILMILSCLCSGDIPSDNYDSSDFTLGFIVGNSFDNSSSWGDSSGSYGYEKCS